MNVEIKLNEMANEGLLSYERIALACLAFMSEDDIREMARNEELFDYSDTEEKTYEVYEVSHGGRVFLESFGNECELESAEYAEFYSDEHGTTVIVEEVTDNGGETRETHRFG